VIRTGLARASFVRDSLDGRDPRGVGGGPYGMSQACCMHCTYGNQIAPTGRRRAGIYPAGYLRAVRDGARGRLDLREAHRASQLTCGVADRYRAAAALMWVNALVWPRR